MGHQLVLERIDWLAELRSLQVRHVHFYQLLQAVSHHFAGARVGKEDLILFVFDKDGVIGVLENDAEAGLALAEGLFRLLALGNIAHGAANQEMLT